MSDRWRRAGLPYGTVPDDPVPVTWDEDELEEVESYVHPDAKEDCGTQP